jgi:hypothetical protein
MDVNSRRHIPVNVGHGFEQFSMGWFIVDEELETQRILDFVRKFDVKAFSRMSVGLANAGIPVLTVYAEARPN